MWKLKVLIQAVLAHLPGGERINHVLQRANAGRRTSLTTRADDLAKAVAAVKSCHPIKNAVIVEVGTGWDALPTLVLSAEGAKRVHTYDHVRHLRHDLAVRAAMEAAQRRPSDWGALWPLVKTADLKSLLHRARVSYTAPGDATRTGLPDGSVDIYFSYAVLEHVPEAAARAIMDEARRVLKPDGVFYALIGLHDHYNGFDRRVSKVNFLKYPDWIWGPLVQNRISYHNRLREKDFLDMLRFAHAEVVEVNSTVDPEDVRRVRDMRIDGRFRGYTPEQLAVTQTEIIARFPRQERMAA